MSGSLNPNTRKTVFAIAATFVIAVLLIVLTKPVQAYEVQVSGLPDSIPLGQETTIVIAIDLEGARSVPIEKVELMLLNSSKGIISIGTFEANGTIIDDGGFILLVGVTGGTINDGRGYDSTTGIIYSVKILLKSSDFEASKGNEFTAIVDRGGGLSALRSPSGSFDIVGVNPWPIVILGVAVVEVCIFLVMYLLFKKRPKVRKRKLRKK